MTMTMNTTTNASVYCQGLFTLASTLNSSKSPAEIINSIVESVAKTMRAKGCALMLLTPDEKILLHTASFGLSDWFVRKGPVVVDISMAETLKGNPLIVLDATADERVQYQKQLKQEGIVSVLSVPVTLRQRVIGVMRVYTSEPYHFTPADVSFACTAANFGAIALESARCYDTLQKDYATFRQDMLQWRAELGDEWMMEPGVVPQKPRLVSIPPGG
jgi:signal transduction protein with GAF and PtsI domain